MSETPRPPVDLSLGREAKLLASGSSSESKESRRSPENRALQIAGFNVLFKKYEEKMAPLWGRLEKGEDLSDQERKDAIGYKVTLDGVERLTAEPHRLDNPALPEGLPGDEFVNTYQTPDGRVRKQREGLVTNHMTDWAQREIDSGNDDRLLKLSRQVVWENSMPYAELHKTPGSINLEDRTRQEAGAFIHDTGEGSSGRNAEGQKIRDSRHPDGSKEHELEDWVAAETELRSREEYIIDPPLPTDRLNFVNPPRFEFDPDIEPREINVPDVIENGPVRTGRIREIRSDEEIREWIVDLGGGVRKVGETNFSSDYRVPAARSIDDLEKMDSVNARGAVDSERELLDKVHDRDRKSRIVEDKFGERNDSDEARLDEAVAESKSFREKVLVEEAGISDEKIESEVEARGERLSKIKGVGKRIWDRTRAYARDKIPSVGWPKIPMPGKKAGLVGVGALAMVLIAQCGEKNKAQPAEMPGRTYEPNAPTQIMMDRPGLTSPPQIVESVTGSPFEASVKPVSPEVPVAPEGGFGGGKGPATKEEDFSVAEGKQNVRGLVEHQLAQKLNPGFKRVSDEAKAAKARGENVNYADVTGDYAAGTLEDFKGKLKDQYGEKRAREIYDKFINDLVDQEESVLVNYNQGVSVAPDGTIEGITDKVNLIDLNKEAEVSFSMAANGGYSSTQYRGVLDQFESSFKPGE